MKNCLAFGFALLMCLGCAEEPVQDPAIPAAESEENLEAAQQYELRGVVTARDGELLTVDHEAIGDWMSAMTMSFPVRGVDEAAMPAVGDSITATVNVEGNEYWLTDITPSSAEHPMMDEDQEMMDPEETDHREDMEEQEMMEDPPGE